MNDRFIFKKLIILAVISASFLHGVAAPGTIELAKPSAKQVAFADWEVGAFFHYNINPFSGQQHSDGQPLAAMFNPTELDVDQWLRTAKSMGARYAVLTARHEGGFCLWPSKTTEYTIANSPYKNGKGDLVREFIDACHRHGLKVGLYHTATYDANAVLGGDYASWGQQKLPLVWGSLERGRAFKEAYERDPGLQERVFKMQLAQMTELLTQYGPIDFMWSDHWDAKDPNGLWRAVTDLAAELQPNMVFMGPETTTPGNETGHVVYPMWNAVDTVDGTKYSRIAAVKGDVTTQNDYGLLEGDVRSGTPLGKFWRVRECTTHSAMHYGGWFWQPDDVLKTHPRHHWEHLDLYYRTVGLGANTIINLPPDRRGLIPEDIAAAAEAFGDEIRKRFSKPIAKTNGVKEGDVVVLEWRRPTEINTIITMENIVNGQKVVQYTLEAYVNGKWQELESQNRLVAMKHYNSNPGYETIGHKKIDRVKPVVTNKIRFRCLKSVSGPVEIRGMAVFRCDPILRTSGAKFPYLSSVHPIFDDAHNGMKLDRDYKGGELSLNGRFYAHGILLCPSAETKVGMAEYDLKPFRKAKGLKADIGIEDMVGKGGSCEFIVEGCINEEWVELYKSPVLRGGSETLSIEVKFPKHMKKLRLKTTDGGNGVGADHALWADIQFTS